MNRKSIVLGIVLALFPVQSCSKSSDDAGASDLCAAQLLKLQECSVLGSEGTITCTNTPTSRCALGCEISAACPDLVIKYCRSVDYPGTALAACVNACGFQSGFTCPDGTLLDATSACNGTNDCSDGSDETTCGTFTCDGMSLSVMYQCDGHTDCLDGMDESPTVCPSFTCPDGTLTLQSKLCDGTSDCVTDSADERNCGPTLYQQLLCK